ncbi:VCBS repeat-containing protein [Streptomyces sp. ICBB 8177]|uniref:FG-GAP repeat domain-containing protein n=1 Tax=Streptomyces sp. ICBB 8177 TaxID=563922 RepID=UPI000D687549|nr:VCBS repeat-containing protein [Streptomyces sp. ICBB 8177]
MATATALALGAMTGAANATSPASSTVKPPERVTTRQGVLFAKPAAAGATTGEGKAAATGWAEPSSMTAQTYSMALLTFDDQGGTSVASGADEYRQLLDIGDVSGGKGDDLLAITESGQFRLFPSTYSRPSSKYLVIGWGWQTYNQVAVVGDLTGDGRPDLVARDTHGRLWFYPSRNSLTQPFGPRVQVGSGWNMYDQVVGAAHFDGTATGSLLARDQQGRLWLYDGRGDGTFGPRKLVDAGWGTYNQLIGLDYNGDGHGDVIARTESGDLYAYESDGAGGLTAPTRIGSDWSEYNALGNEGHQPDFGKGEIFARYSNGDAYWYTSEENGKLDTRSTAATGFTPATWPTMTATVAPTDNGMTDIATIAYDHALTYLEAFTSGTIPTVAYNVVVGPGDLNGDGKPDLLGRNPSGYLWFIPGDGKGSTDGKPVSLGGGWNAYNHIVGAGDLTGDGVPDIVATTPGGTLYLYPGLGNGAFGSRRAIGSGWQMYGRIAAPGDLTGDGKSDLVAVDSAGRLWLYPGLGDGTFAKREEIGTSGWNGFHDIS